ncbi:MAG: cellulose synthase catalytic subunit (UDP-forming) [Gammaproteobacteria bacterium HGW-Gammaproteobacteria-3]|nr:MAG: cellulose synthase catalytic subunit (UDP-forming) [Gammaproteobacteria bacterium HGW-Gammaproteobacteria-3]
MECHNRSEGLKIGTFLCLFLIFASFFFLAGLRVDLITQAHLSVLLLIFLLFIKHFKFGYYGRILFITLSSFIVLRYFLWRVNYTLVYQDFFSFIGAVTLFAAELYGGLMFFFSVFVNIRPLERKSLPLPKNSALWPSVDVIIPSYDEPIELVKITIAAAKNIAYPSDKIAVYLLDDGGTDQKLNAQDERRAAAHQRQAQFKSVCSTFGITYLSRERNENAKAGNMNAALKHLSGELILVLDADHVPTVDILEKTVGSFVQDEKVFLVQTPHFFINPDPIEKNLSLSNRMPSENFMFYKAIQLGLDFWQSSFFCGSAALLRRKALDEVGGFNGVTITEDSETALKLHNLGWTSHYVMHPVISGLQPETFTSFMVQRMRWAQGMVQNFILHNPLVLPNLKIWQRICYLSNMTFWFFPFARVVFLISPGLYLFFGLKIYNANADEFFSYTLPYLAALLLTNHFLFSHVRWAFVSEIYETMQSLFSIRAVLAVLKNPHHPEFSVTPKMETLEHDFISPLAAPFYWIIFITALAAGFGIWQFFNYPEERSLIGITVFWALFNLLLLLAALGALYEHRQRRVNPRIPIHIDAMLRVTIAHNSHALEIPVTIKDISMGGGSLVFEYALALETITKDIFLVIPDKSILPIKVTLANTFKDKQHSYGVKYEHSTPQEYLNIVRFVHGDSGKWVRIQQNLGTDPGLIKSMSFMVNIGVYHGLSHIKRALSSTFKKIIIRYA